MSLEQPQSGVALTRAAGAGATKLAAVFGGHGDDELVALVELRDLFHRNQEFLDQLIQLSCSTLKGLTTRPETGGFYDGTGLDLKTWLDDEHSAPSEDILAQAPFSFPLSTILGLAHWVVVCKTLSMRPDELGTLCGAVTGYSAGIFVATVVAQADGWLSFYRLSAFAIQQSLLVALQAHSGGPAAAVPASVVAECVRLGVGQPSSMLRVGGTPREVVEETMRLENECQRHATAQPQSSQVVHMAAVMSRNTFLLAGSSEGLCGVCKRLNATRVTPGLDQSRVVFHRRKWPTTLCFLPVSAPFHTPLLSLDTVHVPLSPRIPLLHPGDGHNVQEHRGRRTCGDVFAMILREPFDWPSTCQALGADYILDFGIGSWTQECMLGTSTCVIPMRSPDGVGWRAFSSQHLAPPALSWQARFGPRLVRRHGRVHVCTNMTKRFHVPPLMVAGMTPTTAAWELVAAITNAGYHVELALGGYHAPPALERALRTLAATIPPGRVITCNLLYAQPQTTEWQIALLKRLIDDGLPIGGLTVGAGVPSPGVIADWVDKLSLAHISLKPGTLDAIYQVVEIARLHPDCTIGLQWTGGRAGGHHSYEDFERPILDSYAHIRACSNIVLVAGSGFGDANGSLPYLTGSWACEFGCPPMPFDGVLLGSRMMVAKEARTSVSVKELIVQAPGVDSADWSTSFFKPTGGVITIASEFGHPIHVLATRGAMRWKEFDDRIFSIRDPARRVEYLQTHQDHIIDGLNADCVRPWFAIDALGRNVHLEDMTYLGIVHRMCDLMSAGQESRWIDPSYLRLVHDFIQEASLRFGRSVNKWSDDPTELPHQFGHAYGEDAAAQIYPEDAMILLSLCRRRGQKPVPFIPRLDRDFETWFKKDTLWQSENVGAVFDQDVQRVCVIHGPVAARFSTSVDESAQDILDGICQAYAKLLEQSGLSIDEEPEMDIISEPTQLEVDRYPGLAVSTDGHVTSYEFLLNGILPTLESLADHIAAHEDSWLKACILNEWIFDGCRRAKNPIRAAFQTHAGYRLEVLRSDNGKVQQATLIQSTARVGKPITSSLQLVMSDPGIVESTLTVPTCPSQAPLSITFEIEVQRQAGVLELHDACTARNATIMAFYASLWPCSKRLSPLKRPSANFFYESGEYVISRNEVREFVNVISQATPPDMRSWKPEGCVPLGFCVVIAWEALIQPLVHSDLDCDLLRLLHVSIDFKYMPMASPLETGQTVKTASRITALTVQPAGQMIEVTAWIKRGKETVVVVKTEFLIQGTYQDVEVSEFSMISEPEMIVEVNTAACAAVLKSRKWLQLSLTPQQGLLNRTLHFQLTSHRTWPKSPASTASLRVLGTVSNIVAGKIAEEVGQIWFEESTCVGNPVMDFLHRYGRLKSTPIELAHPGWSTDATIDFVAPGASFPYARASKDANPIHVSDLFARFAGLPGVIIHGMHTSAIVHTCMEWIVGDSSCSRFRRWQALFHAKVFPNERLRIQFRHSKMVQGQMLFTVQVTKVEDGSRVMSAEAIVEQARTAYVFTGQGSQRVGMGMTLYESSSAAKALWDRAEDYFRVEYGFSLLNIVRKNPTTLTVSFQGRRGRRIRARYLETATRGDNLRPDLQLRGLSSRSTSYVFRKTTGLLFSTQFAQPALVVMELAEFAHLQARGLISSNAKFAGHSLGEYAALAAFTSFMPYESIFDLVYQRALRMQSAVCRDENGETAFSMMAVDPSRIGEFYDEANLRSLVEVIRTQDSPQSFLEIVNFNITGRQYVCTGHVNALWVLGKSCDKLAILDDPHLLNRAQLRLVVHSQFERCTDSAALTLERGAATVPLSGIDVPFHSELLHEHIDDYRRDLARRVSIKDIHLEELIGRWIPNVMGKPFSLDRDYVALAYKRTGSVELELLLENMD